MVFALDTSQRLIPTYLGPLIRVTDGVTPRDVSTTAEAEAGGYVPTQITGIYDQFTGTMLVPSTALTYSKTADGKIYGSVVTSASAARTLTIPAPTLALFNNRPGASASLVLGMHPSAAPAATLNLLNISTGTNAANARYGLSILTDFQLRVNGRIGDAGAAVPITIGHIRGGTELTGATWDHVNATMRAHRYGRLGYERSAANTGLAYTGTGDATNPLAGTISIPIGGAFHSCALWNNPLSEAQDSTLQAWQRYVYGALRTVVSDGAGSWWVTPAATETALGLILFGFSNAGGAQVVTETPVATRIPAEWFPVTSGLWNRDDHQAQPTVVLNNGYLLNLAVGHSNSVGNNLDGRMVGRLSTSGRINEFGPPSIVPTNATATNYGQGFAVGASDALFRVNDDADASWFYVRYVAGVWSQTGRGVRLGGAPGGGQSQMYSLGVEATPGVLREIYSAHPSNARNKIHLANMTIATGVLTSGAGGATNFGSVYPGPGVPGAALALLADLTAIYEPPVGKSARITTFKDTGDRFHICEHDTGATTNALYFEIVHTGGDIFNPANWVKRPSMAAAGAAFYAVAAGSYFGGACYANEPHAGLRMYVSREAAGTWYIDRMDSADDGLTWVVTNVASSASSKLVRPISPKGSTTPTVIYYAFALYTTYSDWRGRYIMALAPGA
jgi:hypothetical protein